VNWYKVSDLSSITGIPENSIRRHIKSFNGHFNKKKVGNITKYDEEAVVTLADIVNAYGNGMRMPEVRAMLKSQHPKVLEASAPPHGNQLAPILTPLEALENMEARITSANTAQLTQIQAQLDEIRGMLMEGVQKEGWWEKIKKALSPKRKGL